MRLFSIIKKNITNPISGKIIPNSTIETLKLVNYNYFGTYEIEQNIKTDIKKTDIKKT